MYIGYSPSFLENSGDIFPTASGGELGTSYFLPRIVGRGRAAQALLTGKEISTDQAEQWGLLNEAGLRDVGLQSISLAGNLSCKTI